MEISFLQIQNFKSIENMILRDIGSALILVGKNSVGNLPFSRPLPPLWENISLPLRF